MRFAGCARAQLPHVGGILIAFRPNLSSTHDLVGDVALRALAMEGSRVVLRVIAAEMVTGVISFQVRVEAA